MSIPYAARIKIVELLEREKTQTTELEIYRNGSQVIPTAATYTLLKPNGEKITDSQTATITGEGTLQYIQSSSTLPNTLTLGEGYIQEWNITIETVVHCFRRMTALVLKRLYPVISDIDLTSTYADLNELRPSNLSSYQTYIDEAWFVLLDRLRNKGNLEYLIMNAEALRQAHINLSLYYIFRDFHSSLGGQGRYLELSQEHHKLYIYDYENLNFQYDESHIGRAEDANQRRGQPTIFLTRPGAYQRTRFNRYGRR